MGWKDTLQTILLKRQAAQQPPMFSQPEDELDMPVSRGVPTNVFQPPQEQPQNPTPNSWQTTLRQQLPDDTVIDDSVDEPAVQPAPPVQPVADRWKNNRLVRNDGESDHDYMRRLSSSDAKGERNWKTVLKDAIAGALRGGGTLPQVGGRQNYGAGAAGGALLGGIIGNVASGLINPDAPAQQWQQRQLGQLRQAEADDLKQRETEADIRYKDTQRQEFGLKREEAARKSRVQALQRQLQLLLGKGQGLNRDNPEAARLIAALEKENLYTPDLGPDVVRAVPIHDEATGEDYWEMTLKDGTVKRTSTGGSHTSATKVNNDTRKEIAADAIEAREALQRAQQDFQREENEKKAANALRLKQTPGAKAAGDNKPARHPVPHSAVVARANQLMYSDPNGELKFGQAYDRAAKEVKDDNGYIDGNQ